MSLDWFLQMVHGTRLRPTATHWLPAYLCHRGQLGRVYTEALDGLEAMVGMLKDRIVHTQVLMPSNLL